MSWNRFFACLTLIALFLIPLPAAAQQTTDDAVNEVAKGLYCPVCESEPLDTCGTQACIDWRAEIREQLEAGQTPEKITEYFRTRFGDRVLAEPPREGSYLLLWFGIPLLMIGCGVLFWRYLQRISSQPAAAASIASANSAPPNVNDDEYFQRIEDALRK